MFDHFVAAQDPVYDRVLAELAAGEKRTHWMWFVFPQLRGLGHSERAQRFGLAGLGEARAYLAHPVLGERLKACTRLVLGHREKSANAIFGDPDDMKFRSSMTLFARAARADPVDSLDASLFDDALIAFFGGVEDQRTVALVGP